MSKLEQFLGKEWYDILKEEFSKTYMVNLSSFVANRRTVNIVYPAPVDVFNAYKYCQYSDVKICIIGQDPYINKFEAHGLAFSTYSREYTPTLVQLEKVIRRDVYPESTYEWDNNLERWCSQGVMLLNSVLTVDAGQSGSHRAKGWETFIAKTVEELDKKNIIFLLWGRDSQRFKSFIKNSHVIECEHPVAASYKKRIWENEDCFNRANKLLKNEINW